MKKQESNTPEGPSFKFEGISRGFKKKSRSRRDDAKRNRETTPEATSSNLVCQLNNVLQDEMALKHSENASKSRSSHPEEHIQD